MLGYLKRVSTSLRPLISHFDHTLTLSSTTQQCDEAHPTCKNCIKSKRDCLGYDPIFKAQPGPAAIQPAPSSAPSMNPLTTTSSSYPPPPQGYMPASSQPFAPGLTAGAASPDQSAEPFDYTTAIDPALEAAGSSQMQVHSSLYDGSHESKLGGNNKPLFYPGPSPFQDTSCGPHHDIPLC